MKHLLTIVLLLIAAAVTAEGLVIKATTISFTKGVDFEYEPWIEPDSCNIYIFMDGGLARIDIMNRDEDVFYIIEPADSMTTGVDPDGDSWFSYMWPCYDKDRKYCHVQKKIWDDYNIIQIYVYYPGYRFMYEGKIVSK